MTNPSTLIFLGLAVVWAVVLLPEAIKRVSRMRRADSIRSFNHQLLALDRSCPSAGGGRVREPRSALSRRGLASRPGDDNVIDLRPSDDGAVRNVTGARRAGLVETVRTPVHTIPPAVRRRRQEITAALAASVVLTLLCLLAFGRVFLVPQLAADVLFAAYLYLVAQANRTVAMVGSVGQSVRSGSVGHFDRHQVGGMAGSSGVRLRPIHDDTRQVAASR